MARYLYSELSSAISAYRNCADIINGYANGDAENATKWLDRHEAWVEHMRRNLLPSGSGFDCGTKLDMLNSHSDKLVMTASYHHMNDGGYYDGWTEHKIVVTPSFTGGINLRISGRNRNEIKEYLHDVYSCALAQDITLEWYQYHFEGIPELTPMHEGNQTHWQVWLAGSAYPSYQTSTLDWAKAYIVDWCEANKSELKVKEQ